MEKNERITIGESDYVKTVLYVYPHLKSFQEAVRQSARNKAALSYKKRDAFAAACEIAEELLFCETLEALERDLLSALGALSDEERYLVGYRYFHAQGEEYPLSYSERSYYRRQNALLQKVRMLLCARGWTGERFLIEFGRDRLFMRVFNAVREGREGEIVKKRRKKTLAVRQTKSSLSSADGRRFTREKDERGHGERGAHRNADERDLHAREGTARRIGRFGRAARGIVRQVVHVQFVFGFAFGGNVTELPVRVHVPIARRTAEGAA